MASTGQSGGGTNPARPFRAGPEAIERFRDILIVRLRRRGWGELAREVKLPSLLKLWLALRHGLL